MVPVCWGGLWIVSSEGRLLFLSTRSGLHCFPMGLGAQQYYRLAVRGSPVGDVEIRGQVCLTAIQLYSSVVERWPACFCVSRTPRSSDSGWAAADSRGLRRLFALACIYFLSMPSSCDRSSGNHAQFTCVRVDMPATFYLLYVALMMASPGRTRIQVL